MKHLYIMHLCTLMLMIGSSLGASSLTAYDNQTIYKTTNHVFSYNDIAQGFVRLNDGFTVMPSSCVTMDVVFSVSGSIDLRETSTIRLLKDLTFDSGVTLTTGGNIDGRGHTLQLNGDFRIQAGKVLHFNGNTIIDAQGHEIVIGENAEIFVDTNITLTIANATIKTTRNAPTYPPLRLAATTSKLALCDVTFALADDFLFQSGQFFIHNDVTITGTSAFVYHSPVPSFITKNSCLFFDHALTFSIAPATFTDAPYSLKNTYTDCNFIKMADETSQLYLDGCTLQTTNTGLRISRGTVFCDDTVTIKTDPTLTLTSLSLQASEGNDMTAFEVAWSPDGKYIAIGTLSGSPGLAIYYFDGTSLTRVLQSNTPSHLIHWSPDGKYIALRSGVYAFDGTSLTQVAALGVAVCVRWSHDGKFLAVTDGATVRVYKFDGMALSLLDHVDGALVDWSPDDKYLSVCVVEDSLRIYSFNGTNLALVATSAETDIDSLGTTQWSPDGRYVAIAAAAFWIMRIYRFDGNSLMPIITIDGLNPYRSARWSPDGRYISTTLSGQSLEAIYTFDGATLSLIPDTQISSGYPVLSDWRPDGKYLAVANLGTPYLLVYNTHFTQTTTPQALTKSLVLGDSAKGDDYDAQVRLLPGASINLNGKMLYDNIDDWEAGA